MKTILLLTSILIASLLHAQCFVKISSGEQHTVAIADDGTLWGWGSNTSGECGVVPNQHLLVPTQIGTFSDWTDVDCGAYHTIALRSNGDVYTMGYNNNGQCGTGFTSNVTSPTFVANGFINVAAGKGYTSYGIKSDSTLWACGVNGGKYGNFNGVSSPSFIEVNDTYKWIEIAGGVSHTIGLTTTGEVLTTGSNYYGELGFDTFGNTTILSFTNANVGGLNVVDVDAGSNFSMVLTDDGTVYTFGDNTYGQLGNGSLSTFTWQVPTNFSGMSFEKINAGYNGGMAMSQNDLYTWGKNDYMLTSNVAGTTFTPYNWPFANPPIDASMGLFNAAFIIENEGVYNWGRNDRGNSGIGSTTDTYFPELNNASCASALSCDITNVTIDNVSVCDPATNSYTVTITTTYINPGPSDSLHIGGFGMPTSKFSITGSPQTETVTIDFDEVTTTATNLSVSLWTSNYIYSNFSCVNPVIGGAWTAPASCSTSSVDEFSNSFELFPNPAKENLTLKFNTPTPFIIYDIIGNKMMELDGLTEYEVNVSSWNSGVYFIQTENGLMQKFVKQ